MSRRARATATADRAVAGVVANGRARVALRPAAAADRERLFAAYAKTVGPHVERIWGWDPRFQRRRFRERYALENFAVVECAGRFAGAMHVERRPDEIYLALLYLLPEFQRHGIGSMLVRGLLDESRARGKPVALTVIDGNPARALYDRLGFRVVAREDCSSRMVCPCAARPAPTRRRQPAAAARSPARRAPCSALAAPPTRRGSPRSTTTTCATPS
jgi:ribosomal protein S18 acetylase RimI-like enzyme